MRYGLLASLRPAFAAGAIMLLPALAVAQDNTGPVVRGAPPPAAEIAASDRFAVVNADGTLARNSGASFVTHNPGAGSYIVRFNRNVRNCAYTASIGLSGTSGT